MINWLSDMGTTLKVGTGVLGSALTFMVATVGYVDSKTEKTEKNLKEYVDTKHDHVIDKMNSMENNQEKILETLKTLDQRIYKMKDKMKP
jgi:hypothetical protein